MRPVAPERIRDLNGAPVRPERSFVLHWMTASRRVRWNPALERSAGLARELGRPLVVLPKEVEADPAALFRPVEAGFGQRRKMLRRSLAGLVDADGFAAGWQVRTHLSGVEGAAGVTLRGRDASRS